MDKKMDYLEEIQKEFSHIKKYQENDFDWRDKGFKLLNKGKLKKAEKIFKKLLMSQPEHFDGAEGLANVYKKMGDKDKALFFVNIAIEKMKKSIAKKECDPFFLDEILTKKKEIEDM